MASKEGELNPAFVDENGIYIDPAAEQVTFYDILFR